MSIDDEVRHALQPLIDQGMVHAVAGGPSAKYDVGLTPTHQPATVYVNADDPEAHRVDIIKLLLQAGLKVDLHLLPNPPRPRA
jgi:hypothetical protein